ncbi:MAG: hypothetical protein QE279_08695 [Rhodoferax sp.]|nr:hypothetical protein [Rhodoferax sp.]
MSELYQVYRHAIRGAWGVAISEDQITAVTLNGTFMKSHVLPSHQLATEIGKHVRLGFIKTNRPKYLLVTELPSGAKAGEFVDQHPELFTVKPLVVFTPLGKGDDLIVLSRKWEAQIEKTSADSRDITDWVCAIQKARSYIVAQASHPAFALVLADWAISQKRMLVAGNEFVPMVMPSQAPQEWRRWLGDFFAKPNDIREALDDLGWSMRELLNAAPHSEQQTETSAEDWFSSASDVCF